MTIDKNQDPKLNFLDPDQICLILQILILEGQCHEFFYLYLFHEYNPTRILINTLNKIFGKTVVSHIYIREIYTQWYLIRKMHF